jgi:hypothetical protein
VLLITEHVWACQSLLSVFQLIVSQIKAHTHTHICTGTHMSGHTHTISLFLSSSFLFPP